jgi:hypothetical protein
MFEKQCYKRMVYNTFRTQIMFQKKLIYQMFNMLSFLQRCLLFPKVLF